MTVYVFGDIVGIDSDVGGISTVAGPSDRAQHGTDQ